MKTCDSTRDYTFNNQASFSKYDSPSDSGRYPKLHVDVWLYVVFAIIGLVVLVTICCCKANRRNGGGVIISYNTANRAHIIQRQQRVDLTQPLSNTGTAVMSNNTVHREHNGRLQQHREHNGQLQQQREHNG